METNQTENPLIEFHEKQSHRWRAISFLLVGLLLITLVLIFVFFWKEQSLKTTSKALTEQLETKKLVENLEELAGKHANTSIAKLNGLEYLCYEGAASDGKEFKLYYRNESYISTEMNQTPSTMDCLLFMDNRCVEIPVPYQFDGDWDTWLPQNVSFNGVEYLLFSLGEKDGECTGYRLVAFAGLEETEAFYLDSGLAGWFYMIPGEIPGTVILSTGTGINYCFEATETQIAQVQTSGSETLNFGDELTVEVTETGIVFSSPVFMEEGSYYGEFTGTLIPEGGKLVITDAKFGAYVPFDYEDEGGDRVITPRTEVLTDKVVLSGGEGERYYLPRYEQIARHDYDWSLLKQDVDYWYLTDENGEKNCEIGIDVSRHQGEIDWKQVAEAGIEFAYIRVGFRGAGEGTLELDEEAKANLEGAAKNGIKTGVYFYSQAISEKEGRAEAEFVLSILEGYDLDYEVVWDTEYYESANGRGNKTSRAERTKVGQAFCETIANAGYQPMVYASTRWSIMNIDRDQLAQYPFWFAYYGDTVSYSYDFDVWQYSCTGSVPGIDGDVDLNIRFQ